MGGHSGLPLHSIYSHLTYLVHLLFNTHRRVFISQQHELLWLRARVVSIKPIEEFEKNLKNNLYKLWNRVSSGGYFPPPVRVVEIPKSDGGKRALGIPTVGDRVAQMVIKMYLEPLVEPSFHEDSDVIPG